MTDYHFKSSIPLCDLFSKFQLIRIDNLKASRMEDFHKEIGDGICYIDSCNTKDCLYEYIGATHFVAVFKKNKFSHFYWEGDRSLVATYATPTEILTKALGANTPAKISQWRFYLYNNDLLNKGINAYSLLVAQSMITKDLKHIVKIDAPDCVPKQLYSKEDQEIIDRWHRQRQERDKLKQLLVKNDVLDCEKARELGIKFIYE